MYVQPVFTKIARLRRYHGPHAALALALAFERLFLRAKTKRVFSRNRASSSILLQAASVADPPLSSKLLIKSPTANKVTVVLFYYNSFYISVHTRCAESGGVCGTHLSLLGRDEPLGGAASMGDRLLLLVRSLDLVGHEGQAVAAMGRRQDSSGEIDRRRSSEAG